MSLGRKSPDFLWAGSIFINVEKHVHLNMLLRCRLSLQPAIRARPIERNVEGLRYGVYIDDTFSHRENEEKLSQYLKQVMATAMKENVLSKPSSKTYL